MGSAVPLAGRASCGWRCAIGIGGEGVVWVALCCWDPRRGRGMGTVGIGGESVLRVALCHLECVYSVAELA